MEEKLLQIKKILKEKSEVKMVLKLKDWFENNLQSETLTTQEINIIIADAEGDLAKENQKYIKGILLGFILAIVTQFIMKIMESTSGIPDVVVVTGMFIGVFTALFIMYFGERTGVYKGTVLKRIAESYLPTEVTHETHKHNRRSIHPPRRDRRIRKLHANPSMVHSRRGSARR